MTRIIGIRHRVKRTKEGEARPTMIAIKNDEAITEYKLEDETDELDFVLGTFPISWRKAEPDEDFSSFLPRHIKRQKDKATGEETIRVPAKYEGFRTGDTVAMILGGSGDRMAFAMSRRGEEIEARVLRIPPFLLKEKREGEGKSKEEDHLTLIELAETSLELFYLTTPQDLQVIRMRAAYRSRRDSMTDRIACGNRIFARSVDRIFLSEDGKYPEGTVKDTFDAEKANDIIYNNLLSEDRKRESELKKEVHQLPAWQEVFSAIEGCGEIIAAGIMAPIGDIRRFANARKLVKYCGVHVLKDGKFPRNRVGGETNWQREVRQALYQLADQFSIFRPNSYWGQRFKKAKVGFRERHPEVVVVEGKKRFTNGHIFKMAKWRTLTRFTEKLFHQLKRAETRTD